MLMLPSCNFQGFNLTQFMLLCSAPFLTQLLITFDLEIPINAFFPATHVYWVQVPSFWQVAAGVSVRGEEELPHAEHSRFQWSQS